ncbi:MAG: pirin family protein [Planctomycetia bacterium]|nr:pirin family protein [Planctomycetia bacterium]
MIQVRRAGERGHFDHGWLRTHHTFSFGDYYDPAHVSFRTLRVMNEDWVQPGMGFGMHPHRDMEIITFVLEGTLKHQDSLGNGSLIRPGELQRMSAGTGILHSEFNPSATEPVHLYQIWLLPERHGLTPGYEQKQFADDEMQGQLRLVASPDGRDGSLTIHQDASLYRSSLQPGEEVSHELQPGRHAWVQVLRGQAAVNGTDLTAGDGAMLTAPAALTIRGVEPADVLVFDLN